jgi:hypothetical protein
VQTTERGKDQKIGTTLRPLLIYVNGTEVASAISEPVHVLHLRGVEERLFWVEVPAPGSTSYFQA